ncbi:uncharacterized protein LOC121783641 [Salvia splendens]|uniref:uncharacterized protein LOC121783641 n=1 Tax=Salvia splendens TaxID=180675 RepID=UPI001C27DCF9|nr:uncharacterized protein LOC121783641 [Salvia splendens]
MDTSSPHTDNLPPSALSAEELQHLVLGHDAKLKSHQFALESFMRRQDATTKDIKDSLALLLAASRNRGKEPPDPTPLSPTGRGWKLPTSHVLPPQGIVPDPLPRVRLEPPRFNGEHAVDWSRNIQKYYNHHYTPLVDCLHLTSYLFDHPTSKWLTYWEENCKNKTWDDFLLAVKYRFDPDLYVDYVGKLATLRQTSTIEAYQTEFEEITQNAPQLGDDTLMSLFIAGLQDSFKHELLTKRPVSLNEAFALAQQLAANHKLSAPPTVQHKPQWGDGDSRQRQPPTLTTAPPPRPAQMPQGRSTGTQPDQPRRNGIPVRRISAADRRERTRQGLCWYCPEKYTRDHMCSEVFYALMGRDDEDDQPEDEPALLHDADERLDDDGENMVITGDVSSIHVISPKIKPRSIRLQGKINDASISVLIDGGSTHNFIQPSVAEKLSLCVHPISPFRVFVGNGESLRCSHACLRTPITMQGYSFEIDLFILQVNGPDVILGVQWLQELGDVTKNYRNLTMKFGLGDHDIFLQGEGATSQQISYNNLFSLIGQEPECELFEMVSVPPDSEPPSTVDTTLPLDATLAAVIDKFKMIFSVPTELPPPRGWDHHIHLAPDSTPINVRPYRYPYFQKTEIECQDALNAATTPNHFPIPTEDELFDELCKAHVFSKLDLRSGYHQIRMHTADVHKTAFRTHEGHFEFLVMPFGLTNAPSMFQAAMKSIFQPYLRRFVIVFFDDILVYSRSLLEHAEHLAQVLQILSANCFYVKLSKCAFGVDTIDYLGHIISAGELRADLTKISAMTAWPTLQR